MPEKQEQKNCRKITTEWVLVWIGIVFLLVVFIIGTRSDFKRIGRKADMTIDYLQNLCQKYDAYQMGDRTQDLQEQINAADVLSISIDEGHPIDADSLIQFAETMSLSGIFVLDDKLHSVAHVDRSGRTTGQLLRAILDKDDVEKLLHNPAENVADQIHIGRNDYNYAVSVADDSNEVVICYTDITGRKNDQNELSLQSMLDGNSFSSQAVVAITDGKTVLGTNKEQMMGLPVEKCRFTDVKLDGTENGNDSLIRLNDGSHVWYGTHALYRDYYLYVFYKNTDMFSNRISYLAIAATAYLLVAFLILILQQHSKKLMMDKEEKEYHLIHAIGSIYSTNLLLHLDENTLEMITAPEVMHQLLDDEPRADVAINKIREHLVHPDHRQGFREFTDWLTIRERLEGRDFLGFSFEDVNNRWYQSLIIPQDPGHTGKKYSVLIVFRNVSEQKRTEMEYQEKLRLTTQEAERANAAKTDFLRRMSHDIRTPINGIRGMADIGGRAVSDEVRMKDCFGKISQAADFLLDLVNDVLDMSKLESGEIRLAEEPFDLREQLCDMMNVVETQAASRHLTVYKTEPEGTHWHLVGSPLHVRQILMNILSNAIKYNKENGTVTVSVRELSVDDRYVAYEFVCADTGIGMSPEFQKHAYDTFSQEHDHARTVYSGTGLGLSIARKLVDCMGGSIEFVSELGKGTTFTIRLRFRIDEQYVDDTQMEETDTDSLAGEHILVVEDNELNMEIAEYMLTEKGATIEKASDGWQAVKLFAESKPGTFTCILMDIMMPVMNGLEATKKIRALSRADAGSVPIIAMSANAFSDDVESSHAAGMNAHLAKPLDFDKVCEQIHKYATHK